MIWLEFFWPGSGVGYYALRYELSQCKVATYPSEVRILDKEAYKPKVSRVSLFYIMALIGSEGIGEFHMRTRCPHCGVSLISNPIPEHQQKAYGGTHFYRQTGVYMIGSDRTVAYRCPDCNNQWSEDDEIDKASVEKVT